jgi:hypothetical protein
MEGGEIGAVDRKQRRKPVGLVEPVEIDQQRIDLVAEAVANRLHALMHDITDIKRAMPGPAPHPDPPGRCGAGSWSGVSHFRDLSWVLAPGQNRTERLCGRNARGQAVLMEAVAGPCACKQGVVVALDLPQPGLDFHGIVAKLRVVVAEFAETPAPAAARGRD